MFPTLSKLGKKFIAGTISLLLALNGLAGGIVPAAYADSDITVTYNLPVVPGLTDNQFHHNILFSGSVVAAGNGNSVHNNLPDVNGYSLEVDILPAGYIVANNPHPIAIDKSSAAPVNITINIQIDLNNPPANLSGNVDVSYNLPVVPGLTDNQFHHNLTFGGNVVAAGNGNSSHNNLPTGSYQLEVDILPAGYIVANNPHPIDVAVTAGQNTSVVVNIIVDPNNPPQGLSGSVSVTYNLPQGVTDNQFHHNLLFNSSVVAAGNGNSTFNNLPAGNYELEVDILPASCIVLNSPHPIPVTVTNGQTTNVTVNITSDQNGTCGGAAGQNGSVQVTYNIPGGLTDNQFHHNLETLAPVTIIAAGNGNSTFNNIPSGNYQINVDILPANCIVVNNPHPVPVTVTAGQTTNVTINIGDDGSGNCGTPGGGGGGGGGGRNLPPIITFLQGQQTITSLAVTIGVPVVVTVIATDERGQGVTLNLDQDPTSGKNPPSTFNVLNQGQSTVTGTLTWTPGSDSIGVNAFIFVASNGTSQATDTLPITVNNIIGGGGGGGGGGNITGGGTILGEKFNRCKYADNETESVVYLCMLGVIDAPTDEKDFNGNSKEFKFFGKSPIDRAAFTKIMVNITYEESAIERIAKLIVQNNYFAFPDVEPIAWFARFIAVAALDDQVHGYPQNGLFIPWNNIEISEAAKIIFNTASHDNVKIAKDLEKATQDAEDPWFMRYALLAYAYGGFTPNLDQDPGLIYSRTLNRQQAADMIYTTILNAGIQPKGKLSQLKQEVTTMHQEQKQL